MGGEGETERARKREKEREIETHVDKEKDRESKKGGHLSITMKHLYLKSFLTSMMGLKYTV